MDRTPENPMIRIDKVVALRKESVDRNIAPLIFNVQPRVALRKESVDRNLQNCCPYLSSLTSLSARRAWIEMLIAAITLRLHSCRSPQGERG